MPLDIWTVFCKKKLRLFSLMLSFMSSSFSCNLLNFARCCNKLWRISLSLDIVLWSRNSDSIPVSTFPCLPRILLFLTVSSCLVLLVCTCPSILFYLYFLLSFFFRVVRRILSLFVGRQRSNITKNEGNLTWFKICWSKIYACCCNDGSLLRVHLHLAWCVCVYNIYRHVYCELSLTYFSNFFLVIFRYVNLSLSTAIISLFISLVVKILL